MPILVLGDVTIDHFIFIDHNEATLHCRLDLDSCELGIKYGQKIPVKQVVQTLGGNAANVAVGLNRAGIVPVLMTEVGDDQSGKQIQALLREEGINTNLVTVSNKRSTNQSHVLVYQAERTIFSYHDNHQSKPLKSKQIDSVYLTSLGEGWMNLYEEFIASKYIIYQPGTIQIRDGYRASAKVLAKTDLLILNFNEAEKFLGRKFKEDKELLHSLLDCGPKEVVVTKGKSGSIAASSYNFYQAGIWQAAVKKESTGSGDAFASAYVAARLKGQGIDEALQVGTINAGCVMGEVGSQAGLQQWENLMKLAKQAKIVVRAIE